MKKIFIAVVAGVFAFCVGSAAQSYTDSRLGIVAGFTSSSSTVKDVDTKSISLYHAGLAFEIPLGGGFAIQPEAIYQVKGMSLSNWGNSTSKDVRNSFETKVGYLEVPVQIQWGPDLALFRPYVFAEPFIGYGINVSNKIDIAGIADKEKRQEWADNAMKRLEYGCGFGIGLDFWMLQLSVQYFMNMGGLADDNGKITTDAANEAIKAVVNNAYDKNNFNGIKVSAVLFF